MLKIPHSINQKYESFVSDYSHLQDIVSNIVGQIIFNKNWLFSSRIKTKESYYYKLQTGRIEEASKDILACTIVVENVHQISDAEKGASVFFNLIDRRPDSPDITYNNPETFYFDDLRLYLTLKERDTKDFPELKNLVFEMQIKTLLQHAWSVATHDLIYKPKDGTNWAMARVAYQIRAMLEHAEVSIEQVKDISQSTFLAKENQNIKDLKYIEEQLAHYWSDGLGNNVKRLAENILRISKMFKCELSDVFNWINEDTSNGRGTNLMSFSPYEIALEAIVGHLPGGQEAIKRSVNKGKRQVFVPNEFIEAHQIYSGIFSTIDESI